MTMPETMRTMTTTTESMPIPKTGVGIPSSAEAASGAPNVVAAPKLNTVPASKRGSTTGALGAAPGRKAGPTRKAATRHTASGPKNDELRMVSLEGPGRCFSTGYEVWTAA
eukprot:TRINITY_DN59_c0_g1_i1.p2 TRINITY_DN59_c0_g1~~TRINITY_DN59_c0_g1_i1.p2  ORF type:complete len:111 (-),score=21.00 TRINITY_DN59_c0_g1_i1:8-340(-)